MNLGFKHCFAVLCAFVVLPLSVGQPVVAATTIYDFTFSGSSGTSITGGLLYWNDSTNRVVELKGTSTGLVGYGFGGSGTQFDFATFNQDPVGNFINSTSDFGLDIFPSTGLSTNVQLFPGTNNSGVSATGPAPVSGTATLAIHVSGVPTPQAGTGLSSLLIFGLLGIMTKRRELIGLVVKAVRRSSPGSAPAQPDQRLA